MGREAEIKKERAYYRKQILESYLIELESDIKISKTEILDNPNNAQLGEYIRRKWNERQDYLKKEIERLKSEE